MFHNSPILYHFPHFPGEAENLTEIQASDKQGYTSVNLGSDNDHQIKGFAS